MMELINNVAKAHGGYSVFGGVGERTVRNDLWNEMMNPALSNTKKTLTAMTSGTERLAKTDPR